VSKNGLPLQHIIFLNLRKIITRMQRGKYLLFHSIAGLLKKPLRQKLGALFEQF
jgi:hypothetical protein